MFNVHIKCILYSVLSFNGSLGAVCATLLEAIPSIERVSIINLSPCVIGLFLTGLLIYIAL